MKGHRGVECIGVDLRTFFPEYVRQHVRIDQCPADVPAAMDAGRIEGLLMPPVPVEDVRQLVGLESVETVYFLGDPTVLELGNVALTLSSVLSRVRDGSPCLNRTSGTFSELASASIPARWLS